MHDRLALWLLALLGVGVAALFGLLQCRPALYPTLTISSEVCAQLARTYHRADIEAACNAASDLAPLIEQLLGESQRHGCPQ